MCKIPDFCPGLFFLKNYKKTLDKPPHSGYNIIHKKDKSNTKGPMKKGKGKEE